MPDPASEGGEIPTPGRHSWGTMIRGLLGLWLLTPGSQTVPELPRAPDGFTVERLYAVPPEEGSWVAMAFDAAGSLIVSPEKGALRRLGIPGAKGAIHAEKIEAPVGDAQGLLWAYDGLYVNGAGPSGAGFYRLRDRDGDGTFEDVRLLRK